MSAPNIDKFSAWEDHMPGPSGPTLHVAGKVEITNGNQTPVLTEAVPQGINPEVLILDLSIRTSGDGITLMDWKDVKFEKKVQKGQHTSVDIRWEGKSIKTLEVKITN